MANNSLQIKDFITRNKINDLINLLRTGLNPNYEGGWLIRLAARHGHFAIVKTLVQFGADPHLLGESGASTLQLAVYSGKHWNTDKWTFLLSCCDSSQLADGAAVAIIFHNVAALRMIVETGRCNTNIPTTLTGKTVEELAKGFKLTHLLISSVIPNVSSNVSTISPRISRQDRPILRTTLSPQPPIRNLSPSVARFFHQTGSQASLSPQRAPTLGNSSPTAVFFND